MYDGGGVLSSTRLVLCHTICPDIERRMSIDYKFDKRKNIQYYSTVVSLSIFLERNLCSINHISLIINR